MHKEFWSDNINRQFVRPRHRWRIILELFPNNKRQGSVVDIATGYWLDGLGIESRWGRDFPHLTRPDLGPTQPPTMGTGSFAGVKSGRGVMLTPHPLLMPLVKKE